METVLAPKYSTVSFTPQPSTLLPHASHLKLAHLKLAMHPPSHIPPCPSTHPPPLFHSAFPPSHSLSATLTRRPPPSLPSAPPTIAPKRTTVSPSQPCALRLRQGLRLRLPPPSHSTAIHPFFPDPSLRLLSHPPTSLATTHSPEAHHRVTLSALRLENPPPPYPLSFSAFPPFTSLRHAPHSPPIAPPCHPLSLCAFPHPHTPP